MTKKIILAVAVCIFVFSSSVYSQSNSISLKAGTLGAGLEAGRSFSDSISGRIGVNYFTYDYSGTEDDIEYNFDINFMSLSALLDWRPFQGSFRISGGVLYNGNEINLEAKSSATYDIGDTTFSATQVGALDGNIDFNNVAPYLGLGWDVYFGGNKNLGLLFELGALYQGSPKVGLSATGNAANPPVVAANLQTQLAKEETNLQDEMEEYKYYPVIAIGLSYRF